MPVRIAISMGDYNGIGPEIILKNLQKVDFTKITPVVFGHASVFEHYASRHNFRGWNPAVINSYDEITDQRVNMFNCTGVDPEIEPGIFSERAGAAAMQAVEAATASCISGCTDALVTAPISKEAVNKAGYNIPGHTEFLAEKTSAENFMMILIHNALRVGLVTIHEPVREISALITESVVTNHIHSMHKALSIDFDIDSPRIAVLGLNPHAGDGGVIGSEEIEIITPGIVKAKNHNIRVEGPFPADGFFGNRQYTRFDGILAMYHDQGLVPFKTLSFGGGVNVTTGLPIVRTSPDHGTAFDIAGKNKANPSSFTEAMALAVTISSNRLKNER